MPGVITASTAERTWRDTLAECASLEEQHHALITEESIDLSLPVVIESIVSSEEPWVAVVSYREKIVSQEKTTERKRDISSTHPVRSMRTGCGRRADIVLFQPL